MTASHRLCYGLARILLPLSIALTAYLYLYPLAHRCAFPAPPEHSLQWLQDCTFDDDVLNEYYSFGKKGLAPFRLLVLADPQLEGDTSLPPAAENKFPGWQEVTQELRSKDWKACARSVGLGLEDVWADVVRYSQYWRKQLDLVGNDFYLAHIYRTLHWWMQPTHVTVLGDLLGSQWIGDEEFERRVERYWGRVFRRGEPVPQDAMPDYRDEGKDEETPGQVQVLGGDPSWSRRVINVAGNHDIGYAGDLNSARVARFERAFNTVNGDVRFTLPIDKCVANDSLSSEDVPTLRVLVLNSMNLDGPVHDSDLQQATFRFINAAIARSADVGKHTTSTILLTHIPLHKRPGLCADSPYFSYFHESQGAGVREQNMLSEGISRGAVLQGLFGMSPEVERMPARGVGRDGLILTGHDHEGCDVYHFARVNESDWSAASLASPDAAQLREDDAVPGIREVTVRSMMGEFGGNAALVSAWWDAAGGSSRWRIEVSKCALGVQHVWWAVHVLDLATAVVCTLCLLSRPSRGRNYTGERGKEEGRAVTVESEQKDTPLGARPAVRAVKRTAVRVDRDGSPGATPRPRKRLSALSRGMQQHLEQDRLEASPLRSSTGI